MRRWFWPALLMGSLLAGACSDSDDPGTDAGTHPDATTNTDSGVVADDASAQDDASTTDTGVTTDGGLPTDAGMPDTGVSLTPEIVPGQYVQVPAAQIRVAQNHLDTNADTYATVTAKLGAGTRTSAANTRSYEWTLADGTELAIWFTNNDLSGGDTIEAGDRVLWIAVSGSFSGTTPAGIGIGSNRAAVEAGGAYGTPPRVVSTTTPAGTLAQYLTRGLIVAYDGSDVVRTITVFRAYSAAPDGALELSDGRIRIGGQPIQGTYRDGQGTLQPGTSRGNVVSILGEPDSEAEVTVGLTVRAMSYAFIGIEIFAARTSGNVLWLSLHAPYYGTTGGGQGIGTERGPFETYLTSQSYGAGTASTNTPNFICYEHPTGADVGISYATTGPAVATSVTTPLLSCP